MRKKLFYLFYLLFIIAFILCTNKIELILKMNATYNPILYAIGKIINLILFGFVLSIEFLFKQFKIKGKWRINTPKLLFLGAPSIVYLTLLILACYIPIKISAVLYRGRITEFIPIVLGYVLGTSFYKIGLFEIKDE